MKTKIMQIKTYIVKKEDVKKIKIITRRYKVEIRECKIYE